MYTFKPVVSNFEDIMVTLPNGSLNWMWINLFFSSIVIAGIVYAVNTNPEKMDYQDALVRYRNESAMLSNKVRNPEVDAHLQYMGDCFDHGLVRRYDLDYFCFTGFDHDSVRRYDVICAGNKSVNLVSSSSLIQYVLYMSVHVIVSPTSKF